MMPYIGEQRTFKASGRKISVVGIADYTCSYSIRFADDGVVLENVEREVLLNDTREGWDKAPQTLAEARRPTVPDCAGCCLAEPLEEFPELGFREAESDEWLDRALERLEQRDGGPREYSPAEVARWLAAAARSVIYSSPEKAEER